MEKNRVVLEEPDGNGAETIRDIAANDRHKPFADHDEKETKKRHCHKVFAAIC